MMKNQIDELTIDSKVYKSGRIKFERKIKGLVLTDEKSQITKKRVNE